MIFLRPMRSDSQPKNTNSGVVMASAIDIEQVGRLPVELEHALQEGERVELARVPDDALTRGDAEQREQHVAQVERIGEALLERVASSSCRCS